MLSKKSIKRNIRQIFAITEREIFIELRFKLAFFTHFFNPLLTVLIVGIIFGAFFSFNESYQLGYWTTDNYLLFILMAFEFQLIRQIISHFRTSLTREKYWQTFQAMIVAPLNRFNLLLGMMISAILMLCIPFALFFIFALVLYPVSLVNILLIFIIFFSMSLTFGGIGLLIGSIVISKEGYTTLSIMITNILFWLSCSTYPLAIFPEFFQFFIKLNPLYYYFDLLRLVWFIGIDYNLAITFLSPTHISVVIIFTIITPVISVYFFNKLYKKHGITGY
ncbi:MAG: ABC transporter permease [Candidatus Hodarchaeota archaeon]